MDVTVSQLFTRLLNMGVTVAVTVSAFFLMWGAFIYMSSGAPRARWRAASRPCSTPWSGWASPSPPGSSPASSSRPSAAGPEGPQREAPDAPDATQAGRDEYPRRSQWRPPRPRLRPRPGPRRRRPRRRPGRLRPPRGAPGERPAPGRPPGGGRRRHEVPTHLDVQDRLFLGLSSRQAAYVLIGLAGAVGLWSRWPAAPPPLRLALALACAGAGAALAFVRWRGPRAGGVGRDRSALRGHTQEGRLAGRRGSGRRRSAPHRSSLAPPREGARQGPRRAPSSAWSRSPGTPYASAGGAAGPSWRSPAWTSSCAGRTSRRPWWPPSAPSSTASPSPSRPWCGCQPVDLEGYLQRLEGRARRQLGHDLAVLAHDHLTYLRRLGGQRALLERRCYVVVPADPAPGPPGRSPGPAGRPGLPFRLPWRPAAGPAGEARRRTRPHRQPRRRPRRRERPPAARLPLRRGDARAWPGPDWAPGAWTPRAWPGSSTAPGARTWPGCSVCASAWPPTPLPSSAVPRRRRPAPAAPVYLDGGDPTAARPVPGPGEEAGPGDEGRPGQRTASPGGRGDAWRFARGARDVADLIAPGAVEVARDHVRVDRHYLRTLAVTAYPRTVAPGWLAPLLYAPDPLELSLHLQPLASGEMVKALSHRLVQLHSSRLLDARGGRLADPEREVAYEDVERLRDALQRGEERVFATSLYLLLRAPTPEGLDDLTRRTEAVLDGMLAQSRVAFLEQEGGLRACLPLGDDRLLGLPQPGHQLPGHHLPLLRPRPGHGPGRVLRRRPPRPGPGHRRPLRRQPGERQHGRDRHLRRRQELQHQAARPAPPPAGGRRPGRRPRGRVPPAVRRRRGAARPPQRRRPRPPQPLRPPPRRARSRRPEMPAGERSAEARTRESAESRADVLAEQVPALVALLECWSPPPRRPSPPRSGRRSTGPSTPPTPAPGSPPTRRPTPAPRPSCATSTPCSRRRPGGRHGRGARRAPAPLRRGLPGRPLRRADQRRPRPALRRLRRPAPRARAAPAGDPPRHHLRLGARAAGPAPPAAGRRRGLERAAVPRGRGLPGRPRPPGAQVLPGAGDHLPVRGRLPGRRTGGPC